MKDRHEAYRKATQFIMRLMRSISGRSLTALLVSAFLIFLAVTFLWLHLVTPSDGARLQPGEAVWQEEGVIVTPLVDQPEGLQKGDVVLAVNGQSLETWAQVLFQPGLPRPDWQLGELVLYTVRRDERLVEVQVTLRRYPLGTILSLEWGTILFAVLSQLVGTYVFLRRTNDPAARALFLWASGILSATTWSFGLQVSDIVGAIGFWLFKATTFGAYMLFWVAGLHFALVFPRPLPWLSKYPKIIPLLYASPYVVYPFYLLAVYPGSPSALGWVGRWIPGESLLALAYLTLMVWAIFFNFRKNRDSESTGKIRWVAFATLLSGVGGIFLWMLPGLLLGHPIISANALGLLVLPFPISIGIAIVRYHLFDIDHIINRTLVYGALTAIVVSIYILIVGVAGNWMHARTAGPHSLLDLMVSLIATALVAISFQPLRERLQRVVNRLMYGERDDPYTVLTQLGSRLEAVMTPEATLPTIASTIASALKLPYVAVALREGRDTVVAASSGQPPTKSELKRLSLVHQNEEIGQLILSPRGINESFSTAEVHLLNDLARHVEVAVYAVRLTRDLQQSRERLVMAREEERRRIRRDLHDGLGPSLAGLTLKIDAARNMLASNPTTAGHLLMELKTETQAAIDDIRRLAYSLRPPALDELGLVSALKEFCAKQNELSAVVEIDSPDDLPALSAAVEAAAYRIVCEAVKNATRHAQASRCQVSIHYNQNLQVEICDDGRGLPANFRAGVGVLSMRERAKELGGQFLIENRKEGGTRVLALLPSDHWDRAYE